jgi:hypothetical protein
MCLAVVFKAQPVFPVVKVGASEEGTSFVPNRDLRLRTGEPIQHKQHRRRVSIGDSAAASASASTSRSAPTPFRPARRSTHSLNSLRLIKAACNAMSVMTTASVMLNLRLRSESVRTSDVLLKAAPLHSLTIVQRCTSHADTAPLPTLAVPRQNHLDRLARGDVEAMQPSCRPPRKCCGCRDAKPGRFEPEGRSLSEPRPRVQTVSQPAPTRTLQMPACKTGSPRLGCREWCAGELKRNEGGSRHKSQHRGACAESQPAQLRTQQRLVHRDRLSGRLPPAE